MWVRPSAGFDLGSLADGVRLVGVAIVRVEGGVAWRDHVDA